MKTLIVSQSEVTRLLPMRECIDAMADALMAVGRGEVVLPLRQVVILPHKLGAVASMPAYAESPKGIGVKVIAVFPGNRGTEYDSHQGVVLLFDTEHGSLRASLRDVIASAIPMPRARTWPLKRNRFTHLPI